MSISSRITEMEGHIGNAYDKIEDLGIDLTNVDKNINNISSMLENVWNEYPKVTATDVEEASLDGTKKGRMKIDAEGNTYQEQLTGKNLFDKTNYKTTATGIGFDVSHLEVGQTYTISTNIKIGYMKISNTSGGYNSVVASNFFEYTFVMARNENIPAGATQYMFIRLDGASSFSTDINDFANINIQIEEGSTATSYEQYCGRNTKPLTRVSTTNS